MRLASSRAAASNSLQPSVPARVAVRDIRSLAPVLEGGSPSSLMTVASITSSPRANRAARSSSRLGTGSTAGEDAGYDVARARALILGGRLPGGEPQASKRRVKAQAHREQDMGWIERAGGARGPARRCEAGDVEREQHVLAFAIAERAAREVGQALDRARQLSAELGEEAAKGSRLPVRNACARLSFARAQQDGGCKRERGGDVFVPGAGAPPPRGAPLHQPVSA